MSTANRVTHYLDSQHVRYDLVSHPHSRSSVSSAISAAIPTHQIAKAVMLEDHEGRHLMAILPGDYKLSLSKLNDELNRSFRLVKEAKIYQMFSDCDAGAVPPMPNAYHMDAIFDDELLNLPEVFLESGDHETLIQMDKRDFLRLMAAHRHSRFSSQVLH